MKRTAGRPRVTILGCGHVGRAFARDLSWAKGGRGRVRFRGDLRVWSRSRTSVRRCLAELRSFDPRFARRLRVAPSLEEAVEAADVVLLCVSEGALQGVIRAVSRAASGKRRKPVLLVTSGVHALGPLRRGLGPGLALGRFHPLAPVPDGGSGFRCATFGIEGDVRARRSARALLVHWNGKPLELHPGRARTYHAAAALLGGGIVSLFALAEACMLPSVRSRRSLREGLRSFAARNAIHCGSLGPARALTGPLARGSEDTVSLHLRALRGSPKARAAYCLLGETMLALARSRGSIEAVTERRLLRVLRSQPLGR